MPICRLQKNHALSRRGGPSPALSPHPSPTPNDASKAKQRKVYIPEERTLSRVSLSLYLLSTPFSLSNLSLFLASFTLDEPRLFRAISFVLLARINSSLRFPSLAFDTVSLSHPHPLIASVCLSILPTHPPTHLLLFLSFQARSLAHMRANEID